MARKSKRPKKAQVRVRKFDNRWITRRLYLLFSIVCTLFLNFDCSSGLYAKSLIKIYTQKLAKATKNI